MLQDVEFLYRVELGTPVKGTSRLFKLNGFEVASRLSYLLWASKPDDVLLEAAARNELATAAEIKTAALRMLEMPRARDRVGRFHAMWLKYDNSILPPELEKAMRAETAALIERVVYTNRSSWLDVFQSTDTYVDKALAAYYGLGGAPSAGSGWVGYGATGRAGLLSHATFLSTAAKFADTSPTQRGLHIRTALMCQPVPKAPATLGVNADMPPSTGNCKTDKYANHAQGGCATCHRQMDPIGFGLENYDQFGKYRSAEPGKPQCVISGQGELSGIGPFKGAAELGRRLIESETLQTCLATHMYRFYVGREERSEEAATLTALATRFKEGGYKFQDLLLELVGARAFVYRRPD
jgi:hypothetical protein